MERSGGFNLYLNKHAKQAGSSSASGAGAGSSSVDLMSLIQANSASSSHSPVAPTASPLGNNAAAAAHINIPAGVQTPQQQQPQPPQCIVREQDQYMPIANVIRIMRRILPAHAKISDDAKETIQECVSEYISFITGEANERCQREQRKTITAEDVLWAMGKLGFDDYVDPLTLYLHRYREAENERTTIREPIFKRTAADYGNVGMAMPPPPPAFVHPSFIMGDGQGMHDAAAAAAMMGGYYRPDMSGAGGSGGSGGGGGSSSSQSGVSNYDPFAQ